MQAQATVREATRAIQLKFLSFLRTYLVLYKGKGSENYIMVYKK